MSTARWTKGVLMPAQLILGTNELQHAVNDLKTAVETGDELRQAVSAVRAKYERLQLLGPQSQIGQLDLARHLRFAERAVEQETELDSYDLGAMATSDLARVMKSLEQTEAMDPQTSGLRQAMATLESETIEFKNMIPDQNRKLAQEIAALAPAGGWVYLGVDDDGTIVGLQMAKVSDVDETDLRIRNLIRTMSLHRSQLGRSGWQMEV